MYKQIRSIILALVLLMLFVQCSGQQNVTQEQCNNWYMLPVLYNNYKSDTTMVEYWENYWYYRSDDNTKFIPDTLIVVLNLIPSMEILPDAELPNSTFNVKVTMSFKYGFDDDSYNVINPRVSDEIVLLDQSVNFKEVYELIIKTDQMVFSYFPKGIAIKKMLNDLNISIEDGIWDYESRGRPYALNQIIIKSYFMDNNGNVKCSSEFTFPVGGQYNNPLGGRWQY